MALIYDYATVKYDTDGNQLWVVREDKAGDTDRARAIVLDSDSNVYVTGDSDADPSSGLDVDWWTIKYSTGGTQQWQIRYDRPHGSYDTAYDMTLDSDNNVYVQAQLRSVGSTTTMQP